MSHYKIKIILRDWAQEVGNVYGCFAINQKDKCVTIFTDRPGILIGLHGKLSEKYRERLKREVDKDIKVSIVEVENIYR